MILDDNGWLHLRPNPPRWAAPIPAELVIRDLFELDTGSPVEVTRFIQAFGVLTLPGDPLLPVQFESPTPKPGDASIHVYEVAEWLRIARACARHWIASRARRNVTAAWKQEGFLFDRETSWATFGDYLNEGLRRYHARVEVTVRGTAGAATIGEPVLGLYSALCLQLANMISEGLPPRACANENCDRFFVRQQGRAEHDQHRSRGVVYCSRQCARAQVQREYRRKQRKGKR